MYKKMMGLGRNLIKDELKLIDKLIKQYRDKKVFKIKDSQKTTIKTRFREIEFIRRRYEMEINRIRKTRYFLDELLEIKNSRIRKRQENKRIGESKRIYLRNNEKGLLRYQEKLGYSQEQIEASSEELPTLGTEESQMYCVCRDRMKKNRTSWPTKGAEAMLKVIK